MLSLRRPSATATTLVVLLITSFLPTVSADGDASSRIDTAGFWLSFCLLVIVSATEALCSLLWTRYRIIVDGQSPPEVSCRVCGREIFLTTTDDATATKMANEGMPVGCFVGSSSSASYSRNGEARHSARRTGCSTCGGFESMHTEGNARTTEVIIDKYGSAVMVPGLLIRRFNPMISLEAPAGLIDNVKDLFRASEKDMNAGKILERAVHLIVGLADFSLGAAGLALNTRSPHNLYDTLKDPRAPMTFETYSTLFLLYWLAGVVLLLFTLPLRSQRRSIQIFGIPGTIALVVMTLVTVVLFCLGCWKIDYARRHGLPWVPMLSYWIGGASAISFAPFGIEVFHVFGVVGLVLMLVHTL